MDKLTCIAFIMYQSSENQIVKNLAIQLLNGDTTIKDLKKDAFAFSYITNAEITAKKQKINRLKVQQFAEEFLMIEV